MRLEWILCGVIGLGTVTGMEAQGLTPGKAPAAGDVLPIYIEEFFLSEAVRSEDRGEFQFTVDGMVSRGGRQSAADGASAGLDVEYGVTQRLQFGLELPYGVTATGTSEIPPGWSGMNVNVVYQFIRGNRPFALSVGAGMDLPLNGKGETGFEPELLIAKQIERFQVHGSFIPAFSDDGRALEYNVAALRAWRWNLIPTFEFNGRRNAGVNSFYMTPGIYKHLPHRLEAGMGVPVGLNGRSSRVGLVFKMTVEFGGDDDD